MRIPTKIIGTLKLAIVLVVALATMGQAAQFAHRPALTSGDGLDAAAAKSATPGFHVRGHITGLYPGTKRKLVTYAHNPNPFAIVVRSLRANVRGVSGCGKKNVKIKRFKGRRRIGPHTTVRIRLSLRMRRKAPNACQTVRLALVYHGRAVKP